jgi:predicted AAA+ superfamily ATPase
METFQLSQGMILTLEQEEEIMSGDKLIRVLPVWKWMLSISFDGGKGLKS